MALVTDEVGIYDNAGTPQELHCRAFVTYDNVTFAVSRIESWENTFPFAWNLVVQAADKTFTTTIAANSSRNQRLNVASGYTMDDNWMLMRAP